MVPGTLVIQGFRHCWPLQKTVGLKSYYCIVWADIPCQLNSTMQSSPLCLQSLVPWWTKMTMFVMWGLRCYPNSQNMVCVKPYCPIVIADTPYQPNSMTSSSMLCHSSSVQWRITTGIFVIWGSRHWWHLQNTVGLNPYCPIVMADIPCQLNFMMQSSLLSL